GPRACVAVSMFGSAGVMLALPEVRGLPGLLALSFLAGLLGELYRPSTSKLITQAAVGADRVTAFGVYQTGVSAGTAAGPAIAGFLAERQSRPVTSPSSHHHSRSAATPACAASLRNRMLIAPSAGTAIYRYSPHLVWWLALTAGLGNARSRVESRG
ncbi:MAG: MFS transporter, partial [Mycobacterium sp.]|nr:MFS transporter [Mycobacterium sp.]